MQTTIETITPQTAAAWLGRNSQNRPIRKMHVEVLAGAIRRGEWQLNGDAIRFDEAGALFDGQHRLAAVVKAQQPIETLVVRDLPGDARRTVDQGAGRSLGDVLHWMGEQNSRNLASVLRSMYHYEKTGFRAMSGPGTKPTVDEALDVLDRHPGLRDWLPVGQRMALTGGKTSLWGPLIYIFNNVSAEVADFYVRGFMTGADLAETEAVLHLRNRLMAEKAATHSTLNRKTETALMIKAWNFTYDGVETSSANLRWRAAGPAREPFPTIRGTEQEDE